MNLSTNTPSMKSTDKKKYLISILIGILPLNLVMIYLRIFKDIHFSPIEMVAYPLIFGIANLLVIFGLTHFYLQEHPIKFWYKDNSSNPKWKEIALLILYSIILTCIFFSLNIIEKNTIQPLLETNQPINEDIIHALLEFAENPVLLALWFGPVLWIGIALFEEISRIFLLKGLWKMSQNKYWTVLAIILTSFFIGIIHLYQGLFGIISIGIKSIVMCVFYYKTKRIGPLIISHAFYDGIQFALAIFEIRAAFG